MAKNLTIKDAVYQALADLGDKTEGSLLVRHAQRLTDLKIEYQYTMSLRKQWRAEKGIENVDCRTYQGQPRRNMLDDGQLSLQQIKRLHQWFGKHKISGKAMLELIGTDKYKFHSIDQLVFAMNELAALRKAA